jgi:hypothetical protein
MKFHGKRSFIRAATLAASVQSDRNRNFIDSYIIAKPIKAPVDARGMVTKMINGLRKELNCQIKSTKIPKMHRGNQRIIFPSVSGPPNKGQIFIFDKLVRK